VELGGADRTCSRRDFVPVVISALEKVRMKMGLDTVRHMDFVDQLRRA